MRQQDVNPFSSTGTSVAKSTKNTVGARLFSHNLDISPGNVEYFEKNYSHVRRKLGRPQNDETGQINIKATIWGLFMSASMKAPIHFGSDFEENPRTAKNTDFNTFKLLFDITRKLTFDQELEIHGISATDWNTILRERSTLLHEDAIKLSTAKVYVCSDSVPCLGVRACCPLVCCVLFCFACVCCCRVSFLWTCPHSGYCFTICCVLERQN